MSRADLDRLVEERSLVREAFDDDQVAGYWSKALGSLASARTEGLVPDAAFQLAYTAGLQASLAVLAAHGLRVRSAGNHYLAFYSLQKLSPDLLDHGRRLDALRMTRHQSIYEPDTDVDDMQMRFARAVETLETALPVLRAAITAVRPDLAPRLPHVR